MGPDQLPPPREWEHWSPFLPSSLRPSPLAPPQGVIPGRTGTRAEPPTARERGGLGRASRRTFDHCLGCQGHKHPNVAQIPPWPASNSQPRLHRRGHTRPSTTPQQSYPHSMNRKCVRRGRARRLQREEASSVGPEVGVLQSRTPSQGDRAPLVLSGPAYKQHSSWGG